MHLHGGWGIDVMTASPSELNRLSEHLWESGVDAFCPTTLSAPLGDLREAVTRLGQWITETRSASRRSSSGAAPHLRALPLGIHLEGPFLSPKRAGAHAPSTLRAVDFEELRTLLRLSQGTIKLITVASETLSPGDLKRLGRWAQKHSVTLSLGHTQASENQALQAFASGFRGITHAWNAMSFHHREGGALAGAFSTPSPVFVEVIPDGVHLAPTVARMTLELFGDRALWVSDCVPAAGLPRGRSTSFGPIEVLKGADACWVAESGEGGILAGGDRPLPQTLTRTLPLMIRPQTSSAALRRELQKLLRAGTQTPLNYLGVKLPRSHRKKRLTWIFQFD